MQQEERLDEGMRALAEVSELMPELTEIRRLVEEHAARAGIALPQRRATASPVAAAATTDAAPRYGDKSADLVFLDVDADVPAPSPQPRATLEDVMLFDPDVENEQDDAADAEDESIAGLIPTSLIDEPAPAARWRAEVPSSTRRQVVAASTVSPLDGLVSSGLHDPVAVAPVDGFSSDSADTDAAAADAAAIGDAMVWLTPGNAPWDETDAGSPDAEPTQSPHGVNENDAEAAASADTTARLCTFERGAPPAAGVTSCRTPRWPNRRAPEQVSGAAVPHRPVRVRAPRRAAGARPGRPVPRRGCEDGSRFARGARRSHATPSVPIASVAAEANALAVSRRDALRAAVADTPRDWVLRRRLAESLFEAGERDAALAELETALAGFARDWRTTRRPPSSPTSSFAWPATGSRIIRSGSSSRSACRISRAQAGIPRPRRRAGPERRRRPCARRLRPRAGDRPGGSPRPAGAWHGQPAGRRAGRRPAGRRDCVDLADWLHDDDAPASTRMRMRRAQGHRRRAGRLRRDCSGTSRRASRVHSARTTSTATTTLASPTRRWGCWTTRSPSSRRRCAATSHRAAGVRGARAVLRGAGSGTRSPPPCCPAALHEPGVTDERAGSACCTCWHLRSEALQRWTTHGAIISGCTPPTSISVTPPTGWLLLEPGSAMTLSDALADRRSPPPCATSRPRCASELDQVVAMSSGASWPPTCRSWRRCRSTSWA